MEAIFGFVGVLAGVLITSLSEALRATASFRREKSWDLVRERLDRLEQIYVATEEHREAFSAHHTGVLQQLIRGELNSSPGPKVPWARLRMLVNLYAPELRGELRTLGQEVEVFGRELGVAFFGTGRAEAERKKQAVALTEAYIKLDATYDVFLASVSGLSGRVRDDITMTAVASPQKWYRLRGRRQRMVEAPPQGT